MNHYVSCTERPVFRDATCMWTLENFMLLGVVANTFSPSIWEAEEGKFKARLVYIASFRPVRAGTSKRIWSHIRQQNDA